MKRQRCHAPKIVLFFICLLVSIAIIDLTPLSVDWGSVAIRPASTITVIGEAKEDQKNQIASFTVAFEAIEETKEKASNDVNQKMNELLSMIKVLKIPEEDIKTEIVSVHQETEYYEIKDRYESEKGDWRAYNSISIKLKNIELSEKLMAILNESGANSIDGPHFSIDDSSNSEIELLAKAIANAKIKAQKMAAANGQKVKKIITVVEGNQNKSPVFYDMAIPMTSGLEKSYLTPDLKPGSTVLNKTVTVTFELR